MKYLRYMICILVVAIISDNCHQSVPTGIGNLAPKIPISIFPPDDTSGISIETTFRWQAEDANINDSLFFDFYLEAGNPHPNLFLANLVVDSLFMDSLKYDTTYYWKIVAKDQQGDTTSSPVWSFKTRHEFNSPPNKPVNPQPENEAHSIPINNVVLKWHGGDPDYYSIVNYDVLVGEKIDSLQTFSSNQADSVYAMTLLRYDKNYFWKIIAKDDYQNMTEGPVWGFQTLLGETVFNGTFDTDAENKNPSNLKWSIGKEFGADIFVTNEKSWNNQGKSVCFTDSTIEGNSYLAASVAPKKVGMLQFHFLMTSENDYFGVRLYSEKADSNHLGPQVSIREGKLQYYDKSREWNTITAVEINSWYFLQLVFDCDQHYYNLFLNDRLAAENVTWTGTNVATVNSFYFLTFQNRICKKAYIDDVKFFSDP